MPKASWSILCPKSSRTSRFITRPAVSIMGNTYKVRRKNVASLIARKHIGLRKKILGAVSKLARLNHQGHGEKLAAIWRLNSNPVSVNLAAYDQHIKSSILLGVNAQLPQLERAVDVIKLVDFLKENCDKSIDHLVADVCRTKICEALSEKAAFVGIDLGLRLWLFVSPDLSNRRLSLVESVRCSVSNVGAEIGLPIVTKLSEDFSEETLSKKGGFKVVWTSNLLEHLSFESSGTLRIFHHASALRNFDAEASPER